MSIEADEVLEQLRSGISGLLLAILPKGPRVDDAIISTTMQAKDQLESYIELKVGALTDGILKSVRTEVQRLLEEHMRAGGVRSDGTGMSLADLREWQEAYAALDSQLVLEAFAARIFTGEYTAEQLARLRSLLNNPGAFQKKEYE